MKQIILVFLLAAVQTLHAQSSDDYQKDLEALRNILRQTPSFKDQVQGKKLADWNQLYDELKNESVSDASNYRYFYNLSRLFFPLHDNHLGFYQVGRLPAESEYPRFGGNLDSLRKILRAKPLDSLEGIFYYDTLYTVGLYREMAGEYTGVVLESNGSTWRPGQTVISLYEYESGFFRALYRHPKYKSLMLHPIEKYSNYSLVNSFFYGAGSEKVYSKKTGGNDFVNLEKKRRPFTFREIDSSIQYLHLKHFSADNKAMQVSQEFHDSIQNLLTAPNLIVDLRNNEGGAEKASRKYLQLLKKYSAHGKIFVLVNNGTISQGEIFSLQLKELSNVELLGQTTRGMLAYGSNYGRRERLPSQAFEIYVTDMRNGKALLNYENTGIQPDAVFRGDKDWILQVKERIRKNDP